MILDCVGRPCPVPVIEVAKAVQELAVGEVVTVLADDPAAATDLPAWCRMRGQGWLGPLEGADPPAYRVERLS